MRLVSQSKYIVENVRQFFEKERSVDMCLKRSCVVERTAAATGISVRSVRNIHNEFLSQDGKLLTPRKRYSTSRIRINPDGFDREIIRRAFYARKEYPTLSAVLEKVKEECSFPGGRYCLWRVLNEMGFNYKKKTASNLYMREVTYLNRDTHTYSAFLNTDEKTKH